MSDPWGGVCPEASATFLSISLTHPRLGLTRSAELSQHTTKPTRKINSPACGPVCSGGGGLMLGGILPPTWHSCPSLHLWMPW